MEPPRLLVIDDDPSLTEGLTAALAPDYHLLAARDFAAAVPLLQTHRISLVLLDLCLGREDGLALLPRLRELTAAPVILMTAFGTRENLLRTIRARPDDFLEKPFTLQELCRRVTQLLGVASSREEVLERVRLRLEQGRRQPLTLAALAREAGMSPDGLRQTFRARYGMTPAGYLLAWRMRRAAELLAEDGRGIKEVAARVGYADANNFSTAFRRFHGAAPGRYRRQLHPS